MVSALICGFLPSTWCTTSPTRGLEEDIQFVSLNVSFFMMISKEGNKNLDISLLHQSVPLFVDFYLPPQCTTSPTRGLEEDILFGRLIKLPADNIPL